ncbi:MAG: hypothetical protein HIU93_10020 [Acidobacteria bacterium]|nr:hypothetical protein [Acidobacteriota bacterium]MBW4045544.1 hypothetical protein [Acidobacteriota bacterium]
MYPRLFQLGPIALPTYGVTVALALVVGLALASRLAPRLSLDPERIWSAGLIAVFTSLVGARMLLIAFHFRDFLAYPLWMLGLISLRGEGFMLGGMALGISASIAYVLASRLPLRRVLDCVAPAVVLGLAIQSLGCFIAGCDYGTMARQPWAVVYRDRLAGLWYRTPMDVPLHPVQLYRSFFYLIVFALLMSAPLRRLRAGEAAGAALFLVGSGSALLNMFTAGSAEAIAMMQAFAGVAVLAGGVLWLHPARNPDSV